MASSRITWEKQGVAGGRGDTEQEKQEKAGGVATFVQSMWNHVEQRLQEMVGLL